MGFGYGSELDELPQVVDVLIYYVNKHTLWLNQVLCLFNSKLPSYRRIHPFHHPPLPVYHGPPWSTGSTEARFGSTRRLLLQPEKHGAVILRVISRGMDSRGPLLP